MKKVLGMGNALVDVLARIDRDEILEELHLPKGSMQLIDTQRYVELSKTIQSWPLIKATGGSAGNTILALANLGAQAGFIGRIGDDDFGRFYKENSHRKGIDFKKVESEGVSGVALTFVSPDGQRTFGTHLGVAAELHAEHLREDMFEGYDFFHIEGYLTQDHSLIDRALTLATAAGMTTSIDLASYTSVAADHDFFEYLLRKVDIVFANEEEAKAFTGKEPEAALDELSSICKIAVVKVGAKGSLIGQGATRAVVPARQVTPIDTTAAGDFFAAGFLYGLTKGYNLQQCGEIGTLLASEVLQVMGTVLSDETWQRIRSEVARYES